MTRGWRLATLALHAGARQCCGIQSSDAPPVRWPSALQISRTLKTPREEPIIRHLLDLVVEQSAKAPKLLRIDAALAHEMRHQAFGRGSSSRDLFHARRGQVADSAAGGVFGSVSRHAYLRNTENALTLATTKPDGPSRHPLYSR
jgi:hypothetical protein